MLPLYEIHIMNGCFDINIFVEMYIYTHYQLMPFCMYVYINRAVVSDNGGIRG